MSKRRGDVHNWYELPYDDRERLMLGHGGVGRTFAGRVLQLVTGSTGVDDFEWGVTLFAVHPDDLKDCVHTMRYDEASARYAEFGPFVTGVVGSLEKVLDAVGVRS
jgi:chlorite dismutase